MKSQAKNLIEGLEKLPFQLQVRYTDAKGGQYLRVITMDRPVTKDRHFAEQSKYSLSKVINCITQYYLEQINKLTHHNNYQLHCNPINSSS